MTDSPFIFLHPNEYRAAKRGGQLYQQAGQTMCHGGVVRITQPLGTAALTAEEFDAREQVSAEGGLGDA